MALDEFSGPIPGENFTSDTKNYPWHRPPEFDDLDEAIEYIGSKMMDEEVSVAALTMMEAGMPITQLAQMWLMNGIMEGKWTFDYALLLAGPTAHILYIMAKSYGVDCELGIEGRDYMPTVAMLRAMTEIKEEIDPGAAYVAAQDAVAAVVGADQGVGIGGPAEEEKPKEDAAMDAGADKPTAPPPAPAGPSGAPSGSFMGMPAPAAAPAEPSMSELPSVPMEGAV
jgi:hypothetical protein